MKSKSTGFILIYVFIPFMVAYLLSELYRNVNGIVGPIIKEEMGLTAEYLGLMTSLFLVAVAGAQIFTGIWLDRYGPRKTVACLLLIGALGAVIFSVGENNYLLIGRFLIGLGMAGCWTAAFKVNSQWWPPERLALANGAIIGFAGLGALFSTLPTELLLEHITWNTMFLGLSILTVVVATIVWFFAPDHPSDKRSNQSGFFRELGEFHLIFKNPVFLQFAPISILCQGVWLSYQGLWAGIWLREVNNLNSISVASCLLLLAISIVTGNLVFGLVADILARKGIPIQRSMTIMCILYIGVQCLIWTNLGGFTIYLWGIFGLLLAGPIFAYALISQAVSSHLSGRAVSLLNLLATLAGFLMQYGVGVIIELWSSDSNGFYPILAHKSAFGIIILCQGIAMIWLLISPNFIQKPKCTNANIM